MALVFVSHAHSDESLARKVATLLCDALDLSQDGFTDRHDKFLSILALTKLATMTF